MSKKIKELELNNLRTTFKGVKDMVLLEPVKLDSASDYDMRKKLREKKIRVKMVKNTLVKQVFTENGVAVDVGSGPTLLVWGGESIKELGTAVDAILKDLKKDPKAPLRLKEKTAVAEGQPVPLDVAKSLPTRKEAIGAVIAAMMGPAQAIAGCLVGPANNLAGILKAIEEKVPAAGGDAAPAPAPAAG
jgi:large subunit ribosomal protein L10